MHPGQQRVVAPIVEMRDAALLRAEVAHRRRQIDRPYAAPAQAHHSLHIEVEAPHPNLSAHDLEQRSDGIDSKAEQRTMNSRTQRFEISQPIRTPETLDAQAEGPGT